MRRSKSGSNIVRFRGLESPKPLSPKATWALIGGAVVFGTAAGAAMHYWPNADADQLSQGQVIEFSFCAAGSGSNCVIDGDTIRVKGDKVRLVGFNTPEISEPACAAEAEKGELAKARLLELLNSGSVSFAATADRDRDRYGRLLRAVRIDGRNLADLMISDGLAEPYNGGQKRSWC